MTKTSRTPQDPPPWATVIGTTLKLWVERHRPVGGGSAKGRRYGRSGLVALIIVAVAAGAASVAIARAGGPTTPAHATARTAEHPSSAALTAAADTRHQAAVWIAAQVSHATIVACDPLMCAALQQRGFPAADLAPIGAGSGDPLGAGIVVATLAVRSQLGPRLAQVYAPGVIASFGAGASLVQVRVVPAGGAAAYVPAQLADLKARKTGGIELAGNKAVNAPAQVKAELTTGQVDVRLLITLAALTHTSRLQIASFSDGGPGAGVSAPLREATLVAPTKSYLQQLLTFLQAQRPPLLASLAEHPVGNATEVQIEYTAPSPTGLFGTAVSP